MSDCGLLGYSVNFHVFLVAFYYMSYLPGGVLSTDSAVPTMGKGGWQGRVEVEEVEVGGAGAGLLCFLSHNVAQQLNETASN